MKITDVRITGLSGGTVEGGWVDDLKPEEDINTIIEVITDEGLVGVGSAMTSKALVAASVKLLWPLLNGERADEPGRVSEKLRQSTFWQGRGGAVEHAISGIDIALWDLMGKICNQPVARLLGGSYRQRIKPYGSLLFDEPSRLRAKLQEATARGFKAIKLGWRPFGRGDRKFDEVLIKTARETVGTRVELMVDAGGSEQFWPHGYKWALETAQHAGSIRRRLVRGGAAARRPGRVRGAAAPCSLAHRRGGGPDPPAKLQAFSGAARRRYHSAGLHQVRRAFGSAPDRVDGVRAQHLAGAARVEHRRGTGC